MMVDFKYSRVLSTLLLLFLKTVVSQSEMEEILVTPIAGGGTSIENGIASTSAYFWAPRGLWEDSNGALFIVDSENNCIRKLVDGRVFAVAGVCGCQDWKWERNNAPATSPLLSSPFSVVTNAEGDLFFTELHNIKKVSVDGQVSIIAGTGASTLSNVDAVATSADIAYPAGLWQDSVGQFFFSTTQYFADGFNFYVKAIDCNGIIFTYADRLDPSSIYAITYLSGDTTGTIYYGDGNLVASVSPNNAVAIMGSGSEEYSGEGTARNETGLSNPSGVAVDGSTGDIYVANNGLARIMKWSSSTDRVTTFAGSGNISDWEFMREERPATQAALTDPRSLVLSSRGLYISIFSAVYLVHRRAVVRSATSESKMMPSGSPTCYWSAEEDSCGGALQEVVVSSTTASASITTNVITTVTRTYRRRRP